MITPRAPAADRLLGIQRAPVTVAGHGVEAAADWDHLRTPESYLGSGRGERFASPGGAVSGRHRYERPERLRVNHWALAGEWTIGPENVALEEASGTIAFRFHARDANLVLAGAARGPIPFRVLLDGTAPGPAHGADVSAEGSGELREGRLYQLTREPAAVRERTLEITFRAPGARAYAFTFG